MKGHVVRILTKGFGGPGTGVLIGGYLFVRRGDEVMIWKQKEVPADAIEHTGQEVEMTSVELQIADRRLVSNLEMERLAKSAAFDAADEADHPTPPEPEEPTAQPLEILSDGQVSAEPPEQLGQGPHGPVFLG